MLNSLALLASGSAPDFFGEVAALIVVGAAIAYVCHRFGLLPIVGFLITGVLIGPNALGLVQDKELVDAVAELGVILLLFTIGIEFSLEKLARIKGLIFGGGGLQVGLVVALVTACLAVAGVDWRVGVFSGFLVALSSTAIVLKVLSDRNETQTDKGRLAVGVLIFQDLAIIPMVLLVPMLGAGGGSGMDVAFALGKAAAIVAFVLVFARRLLPPVLERVARTCSPELFLLAVMAACFGTAWLTSLAGLSLALGAFLAGLVVSESRFSHHALSEILPLQILFNAAFFISVGMLLDLGFLVANLPLVLAAVAGILVLKSIATGAAMRLLRQPPAVAIAVGLGLSQVGEFSFVLERVGREHGLAAFGLEASGSQVLIAATVLLMALTPPLLTLGAWFGRRSAAAEVLPVEAGEPDHHAGVPHLSQHVLVAGYGAGGRQLASVLAQAGVPFVITTLSPAGADEAEAAGYPVLRGDSARARTLVAAGVERAKSVVVPDDDPAMAHRIVAVARSLNPTMHLTVRTRHRADVDELLHAGADEVVAEELEGVVELFADVLRQYALAPATIEHHADALRRGGYRGLRDADVLPQLELGCELDGSCLDRRNVTLRDGAPAIGRTLAELDLQQQHGLLAVAIERGGRRIAAAPEVRFEAGDRLELRGTAAAFAAAAPLFRDRELDGEAERASAAATVAGPKFDVHGTFAFAVDPAATTCTHLDRLRAVTPSAPGCEQCLREGKTWVHLRLCQTCGHVGCCDSSEGRHATAHFEATGHAIMRSLEPGEQWGWCFVDRLELLPVRSSGTATGSSAVER